jgi:hypothetical protein
MTRSLARQKLVNRAMHPKAMDDLADYWLRLCRMMEGIRPEAWAPDHVLELRLSGFPRSGGPALREGLANRYTTPEWVVTSPDPDTLVVGRRPTGEKPPKGLGLPLLVGGTFDGLIVEVRLAVTGWRGAISNTTTAGSTLILYGEFQGRALIVKALWAGCAEVSESAIWTAPTPWEEHLLVGFDQFRQTGAIEQYLAHAAAFPSSNPLSSVRLIHRLVDVPFGRPRLRRLLVRCAAFAAWLGLMAPLVYLAVLYEGWAIFPLGALGALWLLCFYTFAQNEFHYLFGLYTAQRAREESTYRRAERYAALAPEQAAARLDDTVVRKYTADVLDAGFVHVGDVSPVPFERADVAYRIFHAPAQGTYLALVCCAQGRIEDKMHFYWPVYVFFEYQTFFSDGGRVDSLNQDTHASCVSEPPATTRLLTFPKVTDPLSLYQAHIEAVEAVLDETSATTVQHEPFDLYLRRQEAISETEHDAYALRPYSWRSHLRWYLQLDAKPPDNSK